MGYKDFIQYDRLKGIVTDHKLELVTHIDGFQIYDYLDKSVASFGTLKEVEAFILGYGLASGEDDDETTSDVPESSRDQ